MNALELNQLEKEAKELKAKIEFANAIQRLKMNRDFQIVISTGYFQDEAVRLVHEKVKSKNQDKESQSHINSAIDSIGFFSVYLESAINEGLQAQKELAMNEEVQHEILAGDD